MVSIFYICRLGSIAVRPDYLYNTVQVIATCLLYGGFNEGFAFNQHLEDVIGGSEIQCHLIAKYLTGFGHEVFYAAINSKQVDYATNYHIIPLES